MCARLCVCEHVRACVRPVRSRTHARTRARTHTHESVAAYLNEEDVVVGDVGVVASLLHGTLSLGLQLVLTQWLARLGHGVCGRPAPWHHHHRHRHQQTPQHLAFVRLFFFFFSFLSKFSLSLFSSSFLLRLKLMRGLFQLSRYYFHWCQKKFRVSVFHVVVDVTGWLSGCVSVCLSVCVSVCVCLSPSVHVVLFFIHSFYLKYLNCAVNDLFFYFCLYAYKCSLLLCFHVAVLGTGVTFA